MTFTSILGTALGRCLMPGNGLRLAQLPQGVSLALAKDLVKGANAAYYAANPTAIDDSLDEAPFAILVVEQPLQTGEDDCLQITEAAALKFRVKQHLAVSYGKPPELASFVTSFRQVLGASYPVGPSTQTSLTVLAQHILDCLLEQIGISDRMPVNRQELIGDLSRCLELTRECHEQFGQSQEAWNSRWFSGTDLALSHLADYVNKKRESNPALDAGEIFAHAMYAAFGLPSFSGESTSNSIANDLTEAFETYWCDNATITASVNHLRFHNITSTPHPLAKIDWTSFDEGNIVYENLLIAMSNQSGNDENFISAYSELPLRQFLNPYKTSASATIMTAKDAGGNALTLPGAPSSNVSFIQTDHVLAESGQTVFESEEVHIALPLMAAVSPTDIASSRASVAVAGSHTSWSGHVAAAPEGGAVLIGRFRLQLGKSRPTYRFREQRLTLDIPAGDALAHLLDRSQSIAFALLPATSTAVITGHLLKAGAKKLIYLGPDAYDKDAQALESLDVYPHTFTAPKVQHFLVVVDNGGAVAFDGSDLPLLNNRSGLRYCTFDASESHEVLVGRTRYELTKPEFATTIYSPLEAAISKQKATHEAPPPHLSDHVFGQLEERLKQMILNDEWSQTHGHLALAEDRDDGLEHLTENQFARFWTTSSVNDLVRLQQHSVPSELVTSKELVEFQRCFRELEVDASLTVRGDTEPLWPSRTSWRHLHSGPGDKRLENYLDAYQSLVERARSIGNPYGVFWAAYPFSVSVWSTKVHLESVAVLLSPLHPLRLAWLAGVEQTLWHSRLSQSLAGTVEGWNLPVCGPSSNKAGRLVAIPVDSGPESLFVGWSLLVPASLDVERPLNSPRYVENMPGPGAAASGLNGTSTSAALRSYLRMHPHITTMTVDLAATATTTRVREIDQSIFSTVDSWMTDKSTGLIGGVRVWDSHSRSGMPSEEDIRPIKKNHPDAPLVWRRYDTDPTQPVSCNVRVIQDSGTLVNFEKGGQDNRGVLGPVPLRRFEIQSPPTSDSVSFDSRPALSDSSHSSSFSRALSAVENSGEIPEIHAYLANALESRKAHWTISGEAFLGPGSMAHLVQANSEGTQMLWEWQPPFFDTKNGSSLQRRPYVSITKVSSGFRRRISDLLKAANSSDDVASDVDRVLTTLGTRGVGLSSLVSMGTAHAVGAIGFYITYKLMESCLDEDTNIFVLPLDACQSFLRAMAGIHTNETGQQRADLVVIAITDDSVSFVPIEIKSRGLDANDPSPYLAAPDSTGIQSAISQVLASHAVLGALVEKWESIQMQSNAEDKILWLNGLASLVDAAMKLQPPAAEETLKMMTRFSKLLDGALTVRRGKPLVAYFQHHTSPPEGSKVAQCVTSGEDVSGYRHEVGVIAAFTGAAIAGSVQTGSEVRNAWQKLLSWSLADTGPTQSWAPNGPTSQTPPSGQELTTPEESPTLRGGREPKNEDDRERPRPASVHSTSAPSQEQPSSDGVRIPVGTFRDSLGPASAYFWPSNTRLNQMNVGVVGDLGTGKTQLLQSLVYNIRAEAQKVQKKSPSFLVFDYKEDFQQNSFLQAVGGKVLKPISIPLNIFALQGEYTEQAAYRRAAEFFDVVSKIFPGVGPVQRSRLLRVIQTLFRDQDGQAPTLRQVLDAYELDAERPDSMTAVLSDFVYSGIFSDDPAKLLPFEELLNDSVLVVALKDLGSNQRTKNALVVLFLNMYYEYMLATLKPGYSKGATTNQIRQITSFLLVDEATNIMAYDFHVLEQLLLQGREFGFGVILSSQYLKHFTGPSTNYGEPLLTWFIHKVPRITLKEIQILGLHELASDIPARIANQAIHEAFYVSLDTPGRFIRGLPFFEIAPALEDTTDV